jgi:REP element-mobilizing transposase RayT
MRKNRKLIPYGKYLVVSRVNEGQPIFRFPDAVVLFRKTVSDAQGKYRFGLVDLEILDNAVELIIQTVQKEALPEITHWIFGVFAQRYNRANGRTGHFWEDRYTSEILEEAVEWVVMAVERFAYILRKIGKKSRMRPVPTDSSTDRPPSPTGAPNTA